MILIQRYQQPVSKLRNLRALSATIKTLTEQRREGDRHHATFSQTQSITAVRAEAPDADPKAQGFNAFPL